VTLTALAVAASWPAETGRRAVLFEADPDGGVLALRYQLGLEPGLVTLAAAVLAGRHEECGVLAHAQQVGGLGVVVAPDAAEQVHTALLAAGAPLARWLADLGEADVVVDAGRLGPGSPAEPLAAGADAVLMVCRPTVEQLRPAAQRLRVLAPSCRRVGRVLIG
jgi:MinD-like ATPase involved in chromosome partitioning or flagellar assembly